MRSHTEDPGLYLPHSLWCCVEMPNIALKKRAPGPGWHTHASATPRAGARGSGSPGRGSGSPGSIGLTRTVPLLAGCGLVALRDVGLCDTYFVWASWRNSAERTDSPIESGGGKGKAEAFLVGQRKLRLAVNVKYLISPPLCESSSSRFPPKFQGNLWNMF